MKMTLTSWKPQCNAKCHSGLCCTFKGRYQGDELQDVYCRKHMPEGAQHPECAVCLEPMLNSGPKSIKSTECGHCFHKACLSTWRQRSHTCPICRADLEPENQYERLLFEYLNTTFDYVLGGMPQLAPYVDDIVIIIGSQMKRKSIFNKTSMTFSIHVSSCGMTIQSI